MSDSLFERGVPSLDPEAAAKHRKLKGALRRTASLVYNPRPQLQYSRVRFALQGLFLVLFLVLFAATYHPATDRSFLEALMQLDPLPWLATSLAAREWARGALLALAMIGAGLFIGRFFCSMICPLGALIDLSDWAIFKRLRGKRPKHQWLNRYRNAKFWILAYLLLAAAFGHMSIHWFDPLSIVVRLFTLVLWPVATGLFFLGFDSLKSYAAGAGWQRLANTHVYAPQLALDWASVGVALYVFGGQLLQSRFWCRNLCPVGALFGLCSRPAAVDGVVDSSCIDCKICVHTCTMNAIDLDPAVRFGAECIQCNTCVNVCPTDSITYVPRTAAGLFGLRALANLWRRMRGSETVARPYVEEMPTLLAQVAAANERPEPQLSRRSFLKTGAIAAGTLASAAAVGHVAHAGPADVLRPPGSARGDAFLDLCIRCEACVKACTYNALVAMPWKEAGLTNLWTPRFEMRQGACDTECNACGQVCPTGAIAPLNVVDKKREVIGVAELNKKTCLLWHDEACDICVVACKDAGYDAIAEYFADGFAKIEVIPDRCSGCGWCEYHCPVGREDQTAAAIVVVPSDVVSLAHLGPRPDDDAPGEGAGSGFDFDDVDD